jgi:hypothetical protein
MNKAVKDGIETLHPSIRPHATQALNGGHKLLARTVGGAFFQDLGNMIKNKASRVYEKDIKPALPGVVGSLDRGYNNPVTQGAMAGISTALNSTGSPELGIPLSMANTALSNALDASAHGRDPTEQLEHRYVAPAKRAVKKGRKMLGLGAGKDLSKNLAQNTGRLADSGTDYLIRQMDGHGLGGKVGTNLSKNLAESTGRLADSGTDYLIRQMDGHGCGGEVGDGLYAQGGRGFKKGSPSAKAHMAKIRAMRGKKGSKGGAIPEPPSRSPVTALKGGSFLA